MSVTLDPPKAGARYIWLLIAAQFGVYLAYVTPIALSLAIRVDQLAPGQTEYLGYVIGAGGITTVLVAPIAGMLSDRTRSRLGRRRPYFIVCTALGTIALLVLAQAPSIFVLGVGWVLAQAGWGTISSLMLASLADQLPEAQRGRVSGLGGMVSQLAPVLGAVLAGSMSGNALLLFFVPGAVGVITMLLFICLVREPDSRDLPLSEPLTAASVLRTYVFDPRTQPDFAWNWLGRFLFFFGLTFNTTFTAYFLADRLHVSVAEVAGTVATIGAGGVLAAIAGAMGGGLLSDRLHRRKAFVLVAAAVFSAGAVTMAFTHTLAIIVAASILGNLGIGIFASVDQAIALDVLPDRDTDAGRYMGVYAYSNTIAQGVAPLIAPLFLAIGAADGKNYTLLYLIAAAFTIVGGLTIVTRVQHVR
ncbi:MFS transporter [Actinoplanes sp. NPDC051851]|uniref:MFS transporter n=1 Tax=Actinoplanes sp. NPDC051851 TaxID=3154753 RepID=UPI0034150E59